MLVGNRPNTSGLQIIRNRRIISEFFYIRDFIIWDFGRFSWPQVIAANCRRGTLFDVAYFIDLFQYIPEPQGIPVSQCKINNITSLDAGWVCTAPIVPNAEFIVHTK